MNQFSKTLNSIVFQNICQFFRCISPSTEKYPDIIINILTLLLKNRQK